MGDLLARLRPGLILLDGEEELSAPGRRALPRRARYTDRASDNLVDDFRRLEALLSAAYRDGTSRPRAAPTPSSSTTPRGAGR